jgi:septal ring factor EnvC (AmiA/AmiB activator)
MISKEVIEERKQAIQGDIEKLEKTIADVGKQQEQLQANMFALHGALQQCDQFLGILSEESKENG